jgi:hypothetical protein
MSDSHWVYHWLLYVGDSGDSAVVGTSFLQGSTWMTMKPTIGRTEEWATRSSPTPSAEFAWRWWMDNEIFYRVHVEKLGLTAEQQRYVDGYGVAASRWREGPLVPLVARRHPVRACRRTTAFWSALSHCRAQTRRPRWLGPTATSRLRKPGTPM